MPGQTLTPTRRCMSSNWTVGASWIVPRRHAERDVLRESVLSLSFPVSAGGVLGLGYAGVAVVGHRPRRLGASGRGRACITLAASVYCVACTRPACLGRGPVALSLCSAPAGRGEHRVAAGRRADLLLEHVPVL